MLHGPDEQDSSTSTTKHLEPDADIKAKQKSSELQQKSFINIHSYLRYRETDRLSQNSQSLHTRRIHQMHKM